MWGKPKNVDLKFFLGTTLTRVDTEPGRIRLEFGKNIYINIEGAIFYKHVIAGQEGESLKELISHKVVGAEFYKKGGNLKLDFDNNQGFIVFELEYPYESYTMQTPEGLVVV